MLELIHDNRNGRRMEIVIPTFNEAARAERIVSHYASRFDVVVHDDDSADSTVALAIAAGGTVFRRTVKNIAPEAHLTHHMSELTRAEEIGFSPSASSTFLAHHLRSQIVSAIISFKLYRRTSKLGPGASTHPEANTYRDGVRRLWQVYGPEPFLLIVVFPLILVPGGLMRQVRNLYHLLRPRKAIPLAVHAE